MNARASTLPPAFSLLRSEFNDFLFATVGEGESDDHRPLTVLSAFSREGIDPWLQAAKLRDKLRALSREEATQDLASILATLSDQPQSPAEAQVAAERLIGLLPPLPSLKQRVSAAARRVGREVCRSGFVAWIERVLGRD